MLLRPDLGEATYRPGALHEVDGEDVVLTGQGQGDGLAAEFGQLLEQRTGHRTQVERFLRAALASCRIHTPRRYRPVEVRCCTRPESVSVESSRELVQAPDGSFAVSTCGDKPGVTAWHYPKF